MGDKGGSIEGTMHPKVKSPSGMTNIILGIYPAGIGNAHANGTTNKSKHTVLSDIII